MIETDTSSRWRKAFFNSISLFIFTITLTQQLSAQCTYPDTIRPKARCRNVTVYLDSTGQAGVTPLQVDNGSYDNCNEWYLILKHPCFYCSDIGNVDLTLYVQDRAGNTSTCNSVVTVKDTMRPRVVLKNNFNAQITSTGSVIVSASQILSSISDNCSSLSKIQLGLRKLGTGSTTFPTSPLLTFSCADTGRFTVEVWARDSIGNTTTRTTLIQVSDPNKACNPVTAPPVPAIIGNIRTESGKAIVAQVQLNGGSAPAPTIVKSSDYNFSNLLRGGNYTLTALRDTDWLNGVTTLDIALMTKHVLDLVPFESSYKSIAADANRDGDIDASDIVFTRKLVLRQINSIPGNTAWRFIPKKAVLPPPTSPPPTNVGELLTFNNLLDTVRDAQFVAVKTSDVNGTAQNLRNEPTLETRQNPLNFQVQNRQLEAGKTYDVDFEVEETDASAFQFTLNYDKNLIKIKDLQPLRLKNFTDNNYALFNDSGMATVSWNGENMSDLKGAPVLRARIQVEQNTQLSAALLLTSDLTKAEAYSDNGDAKDVKLVFKKSDSISGDGLIILPNSPNPFTNETNIRFVLPQNDDVKITIFDETGRVVNTVIRSFSKGYNELPITLETPSVSGVFYYQLKTTTHTAARKLVRMK